MKKFYAYRAALGACSRRHRRGGLGRGPRARLSGFRDARRLMPARVRCPARRDHTPVSSSWLRWGVKTGSACR